jgi:hypothetical protein
MITRRRLRLIAFPIVSSDLSITKQDFGKTRRRCMVDG